ncbi:MAG: hypothetical protein IT405_02460 [Candidatus Yanofskybacteria bacterium]|nr:hypothetical protein [Candidatus Yanofskybacteria bacterium]
MFVFKPVVPDLSTLAKTIGGRIEVTKTRTGSGKDRWIARVVGPDDCHVGFRFDGRNAQLGVFSPSVTAPTAPLARLRLARLLSRRTFVIREPQAGREHYLPLGCIRP